MPRKIVMLEANEIPYQIYDYFIERRPGSTLSRRLPRCRKYETTASDTGALSPWITWPTLHRGVSNEAHGLVSFGQDLERVDAEYPPIWKLLVEGGVRTGVFGPLHTWPLPSNYEDYAFFLPDTFAHTPESHPAALTTFQNFNLSMARRSPRNVSTSIDFASLASFLVRAPSLGLRPATVAAVVRQLVDERRDDWKKLRRRTIQPVLAFDLFMKQLDRHRPDFSNFFTNHVASVMHRFWAATFPEEFDVLELGEDWQARYRGEIEYSMGWTDAFFERLTDFADRNPEYLIVVCSSMGQGAFNGRKIDTQLYLRDLGRFMTTLGIEADEWERRPSMDPTVSVFVKPEHCEEFEAALKSFHVDGTPVRYTTEAQGFFDLALGHSNLDADQVRVEIAGRAYGFSELGLENVEVEDEAGSTGYHIPEGTLFVYDPRDSAEKTERLPIETLDVAPSLAAHFGVDVPSYMKAPGALQLG